LVTPAHAPWGTTEKDKNPGNTGKVWAKKTRRGGGKNLLGTLHRAREGTEVFLMTCRGNGWEKKGSSPKTTNLVRPKIRDRTAKKSVARVGGKTFKREKRKHETEGRITGELSWGTGVTTGRQGGVLRGGGRTKSVNRWVFFE